MKNLISLIALIGILISCSEEQKKTESIEKNSVGLIGLNKEQIKSVGILEQTPLKQRVGLTIYANGTIEVPPQNKTVISVQFGGFVKSLSVLDGMNVKKGQTLFTIEHPELIQLQQDYLEVIGNLDYLKAEMERQKTLLDREAGSAKSFQQAKAEYNASMARKSGLRAKLDMAGVNMKQLNNGDLQSTVSITAPFNGVVTKLAVNVGAYAEPTEHLLEIIDLKHSHAEVIIFEKDVKYLKISQKLSLNFSNREEPLDAKIFLIGKEIGKDRTVKVHCHLLEENSDIAPGSYFKASIYTSEAEHWTLPNESVVELDGRKVVFIQQGSNGTKTLFRPIPIRVLHVGKLVTAFEFEESSVPYDKKVVIKGAYDIMSEMLVAGEE